MMDIQLKSPSWSSSSSNSSEINTDLSIPLELMQSLRQHPLFQRANNESFIEKLTCCMHLRTYSPRDVIIVEGEPAKAMFFLLRGSVDVCSADFERIYATLPKGSCFGEIGILYSMPRTATVIARSKCIVATLTADEVNLILPEYPEVEKLLRFEAEERLTLLKKSKDLTDSERVSRKSITQRNVEDLTSCSNLLKRIPYFKECPEEFLHIISLKVEPKHYLPNDIILSKGEEGKELYFIVEGTAEIVNLQNEISDCTHPIRRVSAGDYFGEIAVVLDTVRPADARAVTSLEVFVLKKTDFHDVLNLFPELKDRFEDLAQKSLQDLQSSEPQSSQSRIDNDGMFREKLTCVEDQEGIDEKKPIITPESVCSTTSDQDPTLLPTTAASALRSVETRRRRASVAIWSDPNLVALANRHVRDPQRESNLRDEEMEVDDEAAPSQLSGDGKFSLLNEEILGLVLSRLDILSIIQFGSVSKKCRELVKQSQKLFETLDLSTQNKRVTDTAVVSLLPFADSRVRHLNLSHCFYLTDQGFKTLIKNLSSLESINLNSCWQLTEKSLSSLAVNCPFVTKFDLSNCRKITDAGMFRLMDEKAMSGYPQPVELSLSYCKKLSDKTMGYLAKYCSNSLKVLNLQRCTTITDRGFILWSETHFGALSVLNLNDCSFLTDLAISHLVLAAPHLKILSLSFCCALSDVSIGGLVSLSKLQELDASFCGSAVSDVSIRSFLTSMSTDSMKSLNVRGCVRITDSGLSSIIELSDLKVLNISQCPGITPEIKMHVRERNLVEKLVA